MPNGIDCCNNQTLLIGAATTHFAWMGLRCVAFIILLREHKVWSSSMIICLI